MAKSGGGMGIGQRLHSLFITSVVLEGFDHFLHIIYGGHAGVSAQKGKELINRVDVDDGTCQKEAVWVVDSFFLAN